MNPPPSSLGTPRISVTEPISPAYAWMKRMLFQPFDLAKWVTIGFCAWLAGLGESGTGGSFNGSGGSHHHTHAPANGWMELRHFLREAVDYLANNFAWIIPLAATLLMILVAVWALVLWLNSRGKFMFLYCVARNEAEVAAPWREYSAVANSLFWFRLVLDLVGGGLMFCLLGLGGIGIAGAVLHNDELKAAAILMLAMLAFGLILLVVALAVIHKFLTDFVVPIMFLRGGNCLAAWREFWGLATAYAGQFALYILFQIVLTIAIGAIVLAVILLTCCLAGCLMALPFIGTVVLLPVLVFKLAYSLFYLAQYGFQYDVFPPPAAPPPAL